MGRRKTFGFSFSWKRALGLSAFRGKIARATGIPTTKSGLQRKIGRSALGVGAGIVAGAAAASAYNATSQSTPRVVSQTRTKKNSTCLGLVGTGVVIIIIIAICGLLSKNNGGGNSTPTPNPTTMVQVQEVEFTNTQIPLVTPTDTLTPIPTSTSTPYPPGFRPTDTRWPTLTKDLTTTPYVVVPTLGGLLSTPTIILNTPPIVSNNPTGATAKCKDGTLSYSKTHSGTCSRHGGVAIWYK